MIKIRFLENNYFLVSYNGSQEGIFNYLAIISSKLICCGTPNLQEYGWIFHISNLDKVREAFGGDDNIFYENEYNPPPYMNMGKNMLLQPYEYQKEAIYFGIQNKEALLVLPCGSGKTPICVGIFLEAKERGLINGQGLIVVKASLKSQWKLEVSKFSNYESKVLKTYSDCCSSYLRRIKNLQKKIQKDKENKQLQDKLAILEKECEEHFLSQFENCDLLIANYETLVDKKVLEVLKSKKLECVMCDEIHYAKTHTTDRSKALYNFNDAKIKIGATATPITKDPRDIFGIYKFIKPELLNKEKDFNKLYIRYAGLGRVVGFKNLDKLKDKISNNIFVKTKEEVASQLPKLNIIKLSCDLSNSSAIKTQEILEEIDELNKQSLNIRNKCKSETEALLNEDLISIEAKILALQTFAQELADSPLLLSDSESNMSKEYAKDVNLKENPKLDLCLDKVNEIISSGEKVIIFSRYERMQPILANAIQKMDKSIKIAFVNGKLSAEKRYDEAYNKFKFDSQYKVLLCSDAGAEGLNMGHCKYLIEYDLAISYAIQTQRHGRLERADSSHDNVIVYQLIANNSWDTIQEKIVQKKEGFDYDVIKSLVK